MDLCSTKVKIFWMGIQHHPAPGLPLALKHSAWWWMQKRSCWHRGVVLVDHPPGWCGTDLGRKTKKKGAVNQKPLRTLILHRCCAWLFITFGNFCWTFGSFEQLYGLSAHEGHSLLYQYPASSLVEGKVMRITQCPMHEHPNVFHSIPRWGNGTQLRWYYELVGNLKKAPTFPQKVNPHLSPGRQERMGSKTPQLVEPFTSCAKISWISCVSWRWGFT